MILLFCFFFIFFKLFYIFTFLHFYIFTFLHFTFYIFFTFFTFLHFTFYIFRFLTFLHFLIFSFFLQEWETTRKTCECALCTVDTCCFLDIRLEPKTSVYHVKVIVVSTASGCDVTYCATTLQGFNKHAFSRREAVSDSRGVPRCTEKISNNLRLLTCVDRSTRPIHHARVQ